MRKKVEMLKNHSDIFTHFIYIYTLMRNIITVDDYFAAGAFFKPVKAP